jgi:histone deacetylase 1/2
VSISHHISCPHAHQQNGSVEQKHRHIVEVGLTLLAHASMPLKFWDEAFITAVFFINRLPSKVISQETPFFRLYGKHPDYNFLKTFGCACWPNMRPYNDRKLAFRSKRCVFLGYSHQHKGYKCLDPPTGRVYISRDVIFDERVFPFASLHPNASAQLRAEIALLPDSLQNPFSSAVSRPGDPYISDRHADSSLPANASQNFPQDSVNAGSKIMQTGGDFMCFQPGSSAQLEADLLAAVVDSPGASISGSEAAATPHTTSSTGSDAQGSSAAGLDSGGSAPMHVVAQSDPGADSGVAPVGSLAASPGSGVEPSSAAPVVLPAPSLQQGPVTRLQKGISKPKIYTDGTVRWGMSASVAAQEPTSVDQALADDRWVAAMDLEFQALLKNQT